jgi:hypothetical protein
MVKKSFAPPVTNFSISCDPSLVDWLNDYAQANRTTRSKIVRKALIDYRAEHEAAPASETTPEIAPDGCVVCGSEVLRMPGVRGLCLESPNHVQEPKKKVENPIDE